MVAMNNAKIGYIFIVQFRKNQSNLLSSLHAISTMPVEIAC